MLPEDCLSSILSLTSPLDASKLSLVSRLFKSSAESDVVWRKFLPSDYEDILARSVTPFKHYTSKKELFFGLCDSIVIDGGTKVFALEKSCGRKSYVLSASELSIWLGNDPMHWNWKSICESRFAMVAELKTVSRLEIQGKIQTKFLSPNTTYSANLLIKFSESSYGLDSIPSEVSVETHDCLSINTAYLSPWGGNKMQSLFCANRTQMLKMRLSINGDGRVPRKRKDGWMEIELGEFFSGEKNEEVKMKLMEVKGQQLKGGLIIEGIEVRPKN